MGSAWLRKICIFSIVIYYYFFAYAVLSTKNHPAVYYIIVAMGSASLLLFKKAIRRSPKSILLNATFWTLKNAFGLQANFLIGKAHPHKYISPFYIGVLAFACCDLIRYFFRSRLEDNFISPYRLRWYKDVIRLERFFLTAKTGSCTMNDASTLEYIRHSTRRLGAKFYFCLFCDDPDTAALASKVEVLDIISHNLTADAESVVVDYDVFGEDTVSQNVSNTDGTEVQDSVSYQRIQADLSGVSETLDSERRRRSRGPTVRSTPSSLRSNDQAVDQRSEGSSGKSSQEGEDENARAPLKNVQLINLRYLTHEDAKWLIEKNDSFQVFRSGNRGCLQVEMDAYMRLRKTEKIKLKGQVTCDSLKKLLPPADAEACFRILTQNFETFQNFGDFEENLRQLNNLRGNFISTLINNQKTIDTIGLALLAVQLIFFCSVLLFIFKIGKVAKYVLPPILIFLFPILWNLFDSFMFIIYSHPYDIGDRIYIDGDNLIVKDIGLTSTTFGRWNNENVVVTNSYIRSKAITKIRRSKNQQWKISFYISSDIDSKTLHTLKGNMKEFIAKNPAFNHITIVYDEIKDCKFYQISFIVKHVINHQNGFFMWKVQNKFMVKLVKELNSNDIVYAEPQLTWNCQ